MKNCNRRAQWVCALWWLPKLYFLPSRVHPFSTYTKFSEKLTFLTPWYAHIRVRIREVRNVSFSENFAYVLNAWSLSSQNIFLEVAILRVSEHSVENKCHLRSVLVASSSPSNLRKLNCAPVSIYLFKANNGNTRAMFEICSKVAIKTLERRHWYVNLLFIIHYL